MLETNVYKLINKKAVGNINLEEYSQFIERTIKNVIGDDSDFKLEIFHISYELIIDRELTRKEKINIGKQLAKHKEIGKFTIHYFKNGKKVSGHLFKRV